MRYQMAARLECQRRNSAQDGRARCLLNSGRFAGDRSVRQLFDSTTLWPSDLKMVCGLDVLLGLVAGTA